VLALWTTVLALLAGAPLPERETLLPEQKTLREEDGSEAVILRRTCTPDLLAARPERSAEQIVRPVHMARRAPSRRDYFDVGPDRRPPGDARNRVGAACSGPVSGTGARPSFGTHPHGISGGEGRTPYGQPGCLVKGWCA
jgi:hypothetical protein